MAKPLLPFLRWLPLLFAAMLPAAPAAAPTPAVVESLDTRIGRCFELRRNQPSQAVELADILLADKDLGIEPQIKVLSCVGLASAILGDSQRAAGSVHLIEQHLKHHPEIDPAFQLRAYSNAGSILHSIGQTYRAERMYAETVRLGNSIGGRDATLAQVTTLNNIGLIHVDYLDSPQAADSYYRKALALGRSIDYSDPQLLYNHAINLVRLGQREPALKALEEAEAQTRSTRNVLIGQRIHSARLELQLAERNARATVADLEQTLAIQKTLPDPAGEASTLARISQAQRLYGDRQQALGSALKAWRIVADAHYPQEQYQVLRALIEAHAALGQVRETMERGRLLHTMKMDAIKQQRLDVLAELQANSEQAASQRELERERYENRIRALSEEKSRVVRNVTIVVLLMLMLLVLGFGVLQFHRHRQLRRISQIDALTGLSNRHAATAALNALAVQRGPEDTRHVLFLIDIDHFKQINDTHGHHAGDAVLVEMSARLKAACRGSDLVSRWGGEEFLVACPSLSLQQAELMAARLCQAMLHLLETRDSQRPVTVSLGMAPIPFFDVLPDEHVARRWDYALRMADRALYAAKETRNAWVGYWGARLPDDATAEAVLEYPEAAEGIITVLSSVPRDASGIRARSLREACAQV